jgi:hypothetical protein
MACRAGVAGSVISGSTTVGSKAPESVPGSNELPPSETGVDTGAGVADADKPTPVAALVRDGATCAVDVGG